ncbi:MAG: phage tail protein [Symploca sp. SIO2G7]|nr:phage tail protein [Symploca sp. SIO2G7]
MAILTLIPKFGATQTNQPVEFQAKLGDGYQLNSRVSGSQREEWSVSALGLTESEMLETVELLSNYSGWVKFQWRPIPSLLYKNYYCESWQVSPIGEELGVRVWEMNATFVEAKE